MFGFVYFYFVYSGIFSFNKRRINKFDSYKVKMKIDKFVTEFSMNYNADNIIEAISYMTYRTRQLGKFGLFFDDIYIEEGGVGYFFKSISEEHRRKKFFALYILEKFRNKGLYMKIYERVKSIQGNENLILVAFPECELENFFIKKNISYIIFKHSEAYKIIQNFYQDQRAKRSGIPYIYHIEEGLSIMKLFYNTCQNVMDAYALHPIFQENKNLQNNFNGSFLYNLTPQVIILAMEYRKTANSYLSYMSLNNYVSSPLKEIKLMLKADKIQNYKDFKKYLYKINDKKSEQLNDYFMNWFTILGVSMSDIQCFTDMCDVLDKKIMFESF